MFFKLCLCLVFVSFVAADYSPCADGSNQAVVTSVYINACDQSTTKCRFYPNDKNHIQVTFTPGFSSVSLLSSLTATVDAQNITVEAEPGDWCAGNSACPITAGQSVTLHEEMTLKNVDKYGEAKSVFSLTGDQNETILCVDLTVEWVKNKKPWNLFF